MPETTTRTNRITIKLESSGPYFEQIWIATFSGPHSENIAGLFGTKKLQLNYSVICDRCHMQRTIQAKYPNAIVEVI